MSPRTFSRYFASKEAVFIAVIEDLAEEITAELSAQPSDLGPMEYRSPTAMDASASHMGVALTDLAQFAADLQLP